VAFGGSGERRAAAGEAGAAKLTRSGSRLARAGDGVASGDARTLRKVRRAG